jgi:hypothetical protein
VITKAYIEENGNKRMESEMRDVYDELTKRGLPVELFTQKRIHRRQLKITPCTLVVGYVQTVISALQMLGIQAPPTNDYPASLSEFLHRRVWESTVGHLQNMIYDGDTRVFAKPKDRKKRFTGHIFSNLGDFAYLERASHTTPIICSDVVNWLTEYRVYVLYDNIIGIKHYDGNANLKIDEAVAYEAVQKLKAVRESTAAYALDFGILDTGQTALIEWNDGFALGSYELEPAVYTDMLIARWLELTGC